MITRTSLNGKIKLEKPEEKKQIPIKKKEEVFKKAKAIPKRQIPDVLYTEDGSIFYPCKNCCRAFPRKCDQQRHNNHCKLSLSVSNSTEVDKDYKPLPLVSMENTMNNSMSPKEVNNNKKDDNMEIEEDNEDLKEEDIKDENLPRKFEKIFKFSIIPGSIFTLDLENKIRVVKHLNKALKSSNFTVLVSNSGEIIIKTKGTKQEIEKQKFPEVEIIGKLSEEDDTKVQITISSKSHKTPLGIENLLEVIFPTENAEEKLELQSLMVEIDIKQEQQPKKEETNKANEEIEEELELIADVNDADLKGTIVLEDLDIHICKQCGVIYHTLEELVNHDRYEHRKMRRKFSPDEIDKYDRLFKQKKDNVCPICSKKLRSFSAWPRHIQSHCEIGMFQCNICQRRFTRDDHRKTHEARHVIVKVSKA